MIHNAGLPISDEWEKGYDDAAQDAADSVDVRAYAVENTDYRRGYSDFVRSYTYTEQDANPAEYSAPSRD